jgi:hypothetical protein
LVHLQLSVVLPITVLLRISVLGDRNGHVDSALYLYVCVKLATII